MVDCFMVYGFMVDCFMVYGSMVDCFIIIVVPSIIGAWYISCDDSTPVQKVVKL